MDFFALRKLNELSHQMAFRIILKQFQNKCERFKQTSQPVRQRVSEWASQLIKVIRKMGNVLLLLADEYAFGQQLANCVNWKTNENETKTDETFFFHSNSREEWDKNEHVNGLNDRERRLEQCQHFISSLFLSPNSMERKLWDSHLFMLLLCDSRYFFAFFKSIFTFCFF